VRFAHPYAAQPPRPISFEIETPLEARYRQHYPSKFCERDTTTKSKKSSPLTHYQPIFNDPRPLSSASTHFQPSLFIFKPPTLGFGHFRRFFYPFLQFFTRFHASSRGFNPRHPYSTSNSQPHARSPVPWPRFGENTSLAHIYTFPTVNACFSTANTYCRPLSPTITFPKLYYASPTHFASSPPHSLIFQHSSSIFPFFYIFSRAFTHP
jgi:hypothetical protein